MTTFKDLFGSPDNTKRILDVSVKTGNARILRTEIAAIVYHENGADIHMKSGTIFEAIN